MAKKKTTKTKKTTQKPKEVIEVEEPEYPVCKRNFECDDCKHFEECHEYDMLEDDYIPVNPALIRYNAKINAEPDVQILNEFYEEREDVDFFDGEER
jgi:hypothetical protein